MVIDNFYTVEDQDLENLKFRIKINPSHDIFKGHFPGNPIMPGVMMMQVVKELIQTVVAKNLQMVKCSNVKFMNIVNPDVNSILDLQLKIDEVDGMFKAKTTLQYEDTIALKMNTQYKVI